MSNRRASVRRGDELDLLARRRPGTPESPSRSPHVVIRVHHVGAYVQAMNETHTPQGQLQRAGEYEIRLKGHLANRWSDWFDGLTLTRESDGTTR